MPSADKKYIAGFDLDGVIVDHSKNKLMLAERHGILLTPPLTHSEIMRNLVPAGVYRDIQEHIYGEVADVLTAPLMNGALEALRKLRDGGNPLVLISRRKKPDAALKLLEEHGLLGDIFLESNIHFVSQKVEKNIVARDLGVTHYVDDEQGVLRSMPSVPHRFLFDSYGQFIAKSEFPLVRGWDDVVSQIVSE